MSYDLIINNVSRYISLDVSEIDLFISLLQRKTIKTNEFLVREGEICKYETFVTKGCLATYYTDEENFEHVLDFSIEGWWAEDLYSFFTQSPSKSAIKAIENTEILQISKHNLEKLYQELPKFERFFRLSFQNAYIAQRERITLNLSATAEEKYKIFLKKYPYAEKRFSQKQIASYLGITPEFLSTIRKKTKLLNLY